MQRNSSPSLSSAPFRASLLVLLAMALFIALFWGITQYQSYNQTISNIERNYKELYQERVREELDNILGSIDQKRTQSIQDIEDTLRMKVQSAYTIASHIYQTHKGTTELNELRTDVIETLRPIRWNSGRGYYFAGRIAENTIDLFANDPLLENRPPSTLRGQQDPLLFQDLYLMARDKGAGVYHAEPVTTTSGLHFPGISFIKYFKPFDWYIGAGIARDIIKTTLQEELLTTIQQIRFSKDGHILCLKEDGTILSHPRQEYIGRSITELTDKKGKQYGKELLTNAKNSRYTPPLFYSVDTVKGEQQRLSIGKKYRDWNWILIVDVSMAGMAQAIKEEKLTHSGTLIRNGFIFTSLLGIAVLFLLSVAYFHSRKIKHDIQLFTDFFRKAAHTQVKIGNEDSTFSEFEDLSSLANSMVDDIVQKEHLLRRDELRLDTLLQLGEMGEYSIKDKYEFVLHRIAQITDSNRGYMALVNSAGTHCALCAQVDLQAEDSSGYQDNNGTSSYLLSSDSLIGNAVLTRKGTFKNSVQELDGYPNYPYRGSVQRRIDTPVTDQNDVVLIAGVCNSSREYDYSDVRQMTMLLKGLWLHVQKTCAEKEMARLERQVIAVGEEERSKIGRDLHDDLGSHLSGIELLSTVAQKNLAKHAPGQAEQLATIRGLIQDAIEKTRRLSHGLYPVHIIEHGLEAALEELCTEIKELFSLPCTLLFSPNTEPLDPATTPHIYYIVREAIFNAAKHAKPNMIEIVVRRTQNTLLVTIQDDGQGIGKLEKKKGLGLHTMHYRAKAIGATLTINEGDDKGTVVSLQGAINR